MTELKKDERSLGDLFSELANETSTLVRQEVALAQTEITQKVVRVGTNVGFLAVGGAITLLGIVSLLAALVVGVAQLLFDVAKFTPFASVWIAALIVGVIISIIASIIVVGALNSLRKTEITPQQTVESLKEDAQWVKNQVS
ncbi:MAG: phage holin family protein [Pyrinomonadaceae bacterium]|nr:phage holin family protein [Pyrinomonadaceae bacterium]